MKKNNKSKKNFIIAIIAIIATCAGIGFSALSQTLTIGGTATMDAMKWNVGFTNASAHETSLVPATATISSDKKSVIITCDFGVETLSTYCVVSATITNDSTFDVKLKSEPTFSYNSEYLWGGFTEWEEDYYADENDVLPEYQVEAGQVIPAGETRIINVTIFNAEITEENIPSTALEIPITITMEWIEA